MTPEEAWANLLDPSDFEDLAEYDPIKTCEGPHDRTVVEICVNCGTSWYHRCPGEA